MVTEHIFSNPATRYRLGNALILLGVLTWLPFIVFRVLGETPSLFWFLPFHLAGVIGGARLRASARKAIGITPPPKSRVQIAGHVLIFAGILVWAPYFYLKIVSRHPVDVMDYLPLHLAGVLAGIALTATGYFRAKQSDEYRG